MALYQSYAKELMSKLGRLNDLVKHAPSIGTYHENIIGSYLRNFISKRFSIKTGFVYNSETNEVSPQMDILVIDENVPSAYLFQDDDFVVAVPDAVVCAIEVKTNFDKEAFFDIAKKSEQYRKANPTGFNLLALCFKSKVVQLKTIAGWFENVDIKDTWLNYPKSITILDDCIIEAFPEPTIQPDGSCRTVCNDNVEEKEEALLTHFLFSVMKLCELKAGVNSDRTIGSIFSGDFDKLFTLKHAVFKYGVGMLELEKLNRSDGTNIYTKTGEK
jgi:hypothetical protein